MSSRPRLRGRAARLARLIPVGATPGQAARAPFVLLVVLLLGGGLIGLLVLNSALSEGSFELDDLQKETKSLTDEEQALQRDIDAYSAPAALQRRARELGMVPGGDPAFLDPDGSVKGVPSPASGPQQASARTPLVLAPEALDSMAGRTPTNPGTPTPTAVTPTAATPTPAPPQTPTAPPPAPQEAARQGPPPQTPATPTPTPGR
ncbi:septum formation initiator family protein [Streptomyces sp. YU58]|uniref:septum formation initiator family protein n=1 Tax=Streptomyces sp. SX92 TaxID=3158972 RepID=UPI0027BB0599|nr:septum formation initiator family protein [Streptomyces coralus]WLW55742.1 septum formation initiator family protein [Streptomyces coralus]